MYLQTSSGLLEYSCNVSFALPGAWVIEEFGNTPIEMHLDNLRRNNSLVSPDQ